MDADKTLSLLSLSPPLKLLETTVTQYLGFGKRVTLRTVESPDWVSVSRVGDEFGGGERGPVGSTGWESFEESLAGRVTGSFSESLLVKPVSFWTRSLKVFASAWTKVVGEVGERYSVHVSFH
ncbi:hypothetical protein GH714_008870 [Hevea brasiliensis]|uniref:Uncharacterized protein n=1 Tax=Hevea brasiliensis TaxID=3981 RepID=A0A6A6MH55_HEVBR|nr:hypothetical protein GH714_008870 [Hevea brasiliensis]